MAEPAPTLHTRLAIVEEKIKPLQEFRAWMIALLAGGFLSLLALATAWGALNTKIDRLTADVTELRQDLGARAGR